MPVAHPDPFSGSNLPLFGPNKGAPSWESWESGRGADLDAREWVIAKVFQWKVSGDTEIRDGCDVII